MTIEVKMEENSVNLVAIADYHRISSVVLFMLLTTVRQSQPGSVINLEVVTRQEIEDVPSEVEN